MAQEFIKEFGKKLEEEYSLSSYRRIFYNINFQDCLKIINYKDVKIIERKCEPGYYMNWHIDRTNVIKRNNKQFIYPEINGKHLFYESNKYLIYHKEILPSYTGIYYEGYFEGGELCFLDCKIKTFNKMFILFDSREVHSVLLQKSGQRNIKLCLFYE